MEILLLSEKYGFDYQEAMAFLANKPSPGMAFGMAFGMLDKMKSVIHEREKEERSQTSEWSGAFFEAIQKMKCDSVGKIGETFITDLCNDFQIEHEYKGNCNKNQADGVFDLKINGHRIECKTARMGKSGSFQHESLRQNGCDFYLFIDILPNEIYLSFLNSFSNLKEITGRTPHRRKGATDVFKLDTSVKILNKMSQNGFTCHITKDTTADAVKSFILSHLKNNQETI
jgi:hypothetical protein